MSTPRSFAEKINSAQVMHSGIQKNAEQASTRGWTAEKTAELEALRTQVINLNNEQEHLKAELKLKTQAIHTCMKQLDKSMSEATSIVKNTFPQPQWIEFGIKAKR